MSNPIRFVDHFIRQELEYSLIIVEHLFVFKRTFFIQNKISNSFSIFVIKLECHFIWSNTVQSDRIITIDLNIIKNKITRFIRLLLINKCPFIVEYLRG